MKAVLYVAHGSRVKAGVEEARQFIETVKPQINVAIQEICFLELADPSIVEGVSACVAKGATEIAIIPILLLTANHAKQDIPLEINKAKEMYPSVTFTFGKPFGINEKLIDSLQERVHQKSTKQNEEIEVLLIGRGSSDERVQIDFQQIANNLKRKYNYALVDICYLYGKGPSFENALEQLQTNREKPVYVVPYILFTGLLKIGIQKKMAELGFSDDEVVLCDCLGYDENVRQVLIERVKETLYSYRESVLNG
ncbi:sirohydrochlorin chelatase [Ureibacillus chungkukjangi]|uniref:Sirohydrochlorin ferrochelatase n=1 Tax=Ureibacillus chungkukjangi TaxID=1202712 RepID=A0A318TZH1_9BACL|nr:sirohydrochlorin chelatase [Ureibacillus chungkukjangi]PYF09107.1 sirohydrochlorin ferrochelatase [Ureibacillus chungkukjangi]